MWWGIWLVLLQRLCCGGALGAGAHYIARYGRCFCGRYDGSATCLLENLLARFISRLGYAAHSIARIRFPKRNFGLDWVRCLRCLFWRGARFGLGSTRMRTHSTRVHPRRCSLPLNSPSPLKQELCRVMNEKPAIGVFECWAYARTRVGIGVRIWYADARRGCCTRVAS